MANGPPPLTRHQLERILGLSRDASPARLTRAGIRLLGRLEARREHADDVERARLGDEIETLTTSLESVWAGDSPAETPEPRLRLANLAAARSKGARERLQLGMIALLACTVVVVFVGLNGLRRSDDSPIDARQAVEQARLLVSSRPSDADLRIRRPESEELLLKIEGDGVRVDLNAGTYEVEVSREDCPDSWIREIVLEPGETRRFEPTICVGAGEVVVRSNVTGDRLRIDDLDLGATRAQPHLLGVGDHEVRVSKPGFAPFEGTVRIRADERIEMRAELTPAGGPSKPASTASVKAPPLPFEVVAPSAPPPHGAPKKASPGGPGAQEVARNFLPEPVLPDPIRPERYALPKPVIEFDPQLPMNDSLAMGGSTTWHDVMMARVLSRFDADGSGLIDRVSEAESIPCTFWKETERSFDAGGLGLSMGRLYGFDGSEWHPRALGFAREQRSLAYARMKECGLAP
jgi:hypothetical protein